MKPRIKTGLIIAFFLVGLVLAMIGFRSKSGDGRPGAAFKLGKTETHSSLSSSSTSSSSDNSTFSSRRVLLVADNPHPLSRRIAALLAQKLKDCPQIQQFATTNLPVLLSEGTEAPDFFVCLDLVGLKTTGVPVVSGSLKATVSASMGDTPWQSSSYYNDDSMPPLVSFAWNATLETDSTFTGVRSESYADTARSVADELAKAILKQIDELSTKYPALPGLPAEFYGPYEPVTDFDFLKEAGARRALSYCGLLAHNQTFWQFQTATDPVPQLQRIIHQLEAAGWKCNDTRLTNTADYFIRCRQDETELEIFRHRAEPMNFTSAEPDIKGMDFIVHYRKSFTRAEREAVLEKLFADQPAIETLLPFQNSFSHAQRDRFYALVEQSPAAPPQAYVQLADVYLQRKQTNAAMNMLLRAKALAATVQDPSSLESGIAAAAKRISPKQQLKLEVTPEICRELGFLEITHAPQSFEQERALGQPLVFFGSGERGVRVCSLTVSPPQTNIYPWFMAQVEDSMRARSSSSFTPTPKGDWHHSFTFDKQTVNIVAVPLPDQKRVRFTIGVGQ